MELGSSPISSVPPNSAKCPRTVAMPRCLTWNPTLECAGSTAHVPVGMAVLVAVAVVIDVLLKLNACSNKLANASLAPFACGGKLRPVRAVLADGRTTTVIRDEAPDHPLRNA